MEDILKLVSPLEDSGLLLKGVSETISTLLGTLGARLLGNMLAVKGVIRTREGTARVGYVSKKSSLKKFFYFYPIH